MRILFEAECFNIKIVFKPFKNILNQKVLQLIIGFL